MDLEEKSPTIVKITKLKSDDGRSPRHTVSVDTGQHHFELQTRDGHILQIRVHEQKAETTVFIECTTLSISDGIRQFGHPDPRDRLDEVVAYIRSFLTI